jgi:hypothetical protein
MGELTATSAPKEMDATPTLQCKPFQRLAPHAAMPVCRPYQPATVT